LLEVGWEVWVVVEDLADPLGLRDDVELFTPFFFALGVVVLLRLFWA